MDSGYLLQAKYNLLENPGVCATPRKKPRVSLPNPHYRITTAHVFFPKHTLSSVDNFDRLVHAVYIYDLQGDAHGDYWAQSHSCETCWR